ncbi:unnamed protein product [Mytilus coruscus]|uniref:HSPA12A n=1 Tax=Mytilus coruscus TaxID=42192 RepID=A0A6J8BXP7_MYTCO|nr:unnamed protein product [Mytilus coruscus]
MQLYKNEDIKGEMVIEDVTGKPLTVMKVFAKSIEALMHHLFDIFDQGGINLKTTEIRWVLTAGIPSYQLLIALEPEAASIYCQYLPIEKLQGAEKGFCMTGDGTQYMVVDNGGREPEAVKRTVDKSKNDKVTMTIPRAILDNICKKYLHEDFESVIKASPYNDRMELRYDKLRVKVDLIKTLFEQASKKIVQLITDASADVKSNDVDILLLVGGFSECKVIQENIKASFPKTRIIVPEDAGLAVLKGAVLFGHKPEYIVSRIVRYTYGILVTNPFNPDIHDKHRLIVDGKDKCDNLFYIYAKRGSVVKLVEKIQNKHDTFKEFQTSLTFCVYRSPKECPLYTDEDECKLLGKVIIEIPIPSKEKPLFLCSMVFGNTELKETVHHEETGKECQAVLDLI